jgi:hypothetical protein
MVSDELRDEIAAFVNAVGEPHGIQVDVWSPEIDAQVRARYLPMAIARDEATKKRALSELRTGWHTNQDHGHIRRWGRAAVNIAVYCLLPTTMEEVAELGNSSAVDAVVRFSGWFHTNNNRWIRFRGYAVEVVNELWGGRLTAGSESHREWNRLGSGGFRVNHGANRFPGPVSRRLSWTGGAWALKS